MRELKEKGGKKNLLAKARCPQERKAAEKAVAVVAAAVAVVAAAIRRANSGMRFACKS